MDQLLEEAEFYKIRMFTLACEYRIKKLLNFKKNPIEIDGKMKNQYAFHLASKKTEKKILV